MLYQVFGQSAPVAIMMLTPRMMARYDTKAELFDGFYQFVLGYGVELGVFFTAGILPLG